MKLAEINDKIKDIVLAVKCCEILITEHAGEDKKLAAGLLEMTLSILIKLRAALFALKVATVELNRLKSLESNLVQNKSERWTGDSFREQDEYGGDF